MIADQEKYQEHKDLYALMAITTNGIRQRVVGMSGAEFLQTAYRVPVFNLQHFIGTPNFSNPNSARRMHWVTDRPETVFPLQTMFHVTSNLALNHLVDGRPVQPSKILAQENILTHKGSVLYLIDDFLKNILDISTGEKESFVWVGSEADPQDYFLIKKAGELSTQQKDEQVATLLRQLKQLLSLEKDDTRRISEQVSQILDTLFALSGIREGWYNAIERDLTSAAQQNESRWFIDFFIMQLELFFTNDHSEQFFPIVLEIDMPKAHAAAAVNGVNMFAVRPGAGSARIASLPLIDPSAIACVYSDNELPAHVTQSFRCLPTAALNREHWLLQTVPNEINQVDPLQPFCDTRYSQKLPVQDLIEAGAICPLMAHYNSVTAAHQTIPLLHDLAGVGFESAAVKKMYNNLLAAQINQLPVPGVFEYGKVGSSYMRL